MKIKSKINSLIIASLLVSSVTPLSGYTASAEMSVQKYTQDFSMNLSSEQLNKEEQDLIKLFEAIEKMPESVINKGSAAIEKYMYEQTGIHYSSDASKSMSNQSFRSAGVGDILSCTGAIGYALVTNLTPAKVLKVKSALKSVGGATTFVKSLIPYYKMARADKMSRTKALRTAVSYAAKDAGPAAKEALLDFFGIAGIAGACSAFLETKR